jgi:hypothetical protein
MHGGRRFKHEPGPPIQRGVSPVIGDAAEDGLETVRIVARTPAELDRLFEDRRKRLETPC